jgi:hypothetical protein
MDTFEETLESVSSLQQLTSELLFKNQQLRMSLEAASKQESSSKGEKS